MVGSREDLEVRGLEADRTNWLAGRPTGPFRCRVKYRDHCPPRRATAEATSIGTLRVVFDEPCQGVAPGQAVVCYRDEQVLGGGWIASTWAASRA